MFKNIISSVLVLLIAGGSIVLAQEKLILEEIVDDYQKSLAQKVADPCERQLFLTFWLKRYQEAYDNLSSPSDRQQLLQFLKDGMAKELVKFEYIDTAIVEEYKLDIDEIVQDPCERKELKKELQKTWYAVKDPHIRQKILRNLKDAKARHREIQFFGKVVDQFGQPVADANVEAIFSTMYAEKGTTTKQVKTNANGVFELKYKSSGFSISRINKDGYEFLRSKTKKRSFKHSEFDKLRHIMSDPNNPVLFYMRKKLMPPKYLLADCSNCGKERRFDPNETKSFEFYLFTNGWLTDKFESGPIPGGEEIHGEERRRGPKDFRIEGSPTEDGFYQFCFTPLHKNSGVIASDEILYEVPETGYEPNAMIYIDPCGVHEEKKYVYMKTEDGSFYSRLEIKLSVYPNPDRIYVEIRRITNPNGSRNLEYYDKYNAKVETKRREEYKRIQKEKRQKRQEEYKKKQNSR